MFKTTIILIVIAFTACTSSKMYSYYAGSMLVGSEASDSTVNKYDSLLINDIKPGYYCKRIPADATIDKIDYNEIDWIYVSKDKKVKQFLTANYENCLLDMNWKDKPKEIYRQIKRNTEKFNELYLECENSEYVPSCLKNNNDAIIILNPVKGDLINAEELLFVKGGLIRKNRNYEGIISMDEYKFIGK